MGATSKARVQGALRDSVSVSAYGEAGSQLSRLVHRLEERHPRTHGHSRRVAAFAAAIATELGLAPETVSRIHTAALLHDIGKISTPAAIIDKPGALSGDEYTEIKRHPEAGARMVEPLGDPELAAIVRHHHEHFDGCGYPAGLHGFEIPLGARIVAVADTLDALVSPRPYRLPTSKRRALELLREAAGSQLDPTVVRVALRLAEPPRRQRRRGRFAQRPDSGPEAGSTPPLRPLPG
jgi:putative nucleotidyltransferase with HDIG domain